jgi:putative intracellular protease/amidase
MIDFNVFLFDDFETLDAFGPVEIIGKLPEVYRPVYCSIGQNAAVSCQGVKVVTVPLDPSSSGILLIPGGIGTRKLIFDQQKMDILKTAAINADYVLTVCTGSALLAKTGLIKNVRATSNKIAFDWAVQADTDVSWIRKARWTVDGKYYTSSGVSAGIDMALGFVADRMGEDTAKAIAHRIEYMRNPDKDNDPFA